MEKKVKTLLKLRSKCKEKTHKSMDHKSVTTHRGYKKRLLIQEVSDTGNNTRLQGSYDNCELYSIEKITTYKKVSKHT